MVIIAGTIQAADIEKARELHEMIIKYGGRFYMENIKVKVVVSGGVELVNEFTVTQDALKYGKGNEVVESFMGLIAGNINTVMTQKQTEEDSP